MRRKKAVHKMVRSHSQAEDVPVSQTETVGGQSDVEGPVEPSWLEPEPIQEVDFARMSGAFRVALRGQDQIDAVHLFSVRAVGNEDSSQVCSRSLQRGRAHRPSRD